MGIYDREYYRGETRGAGLFASTPVCKAIILVNVGLYLLEELHVVDRGSLRTYFAAHSGAIFRQGHVWQLLTAAFLHADLYHLLINMYFLWVVGREMEAMYGPRDFLALYLSAAALSTLGWAALDAFTPDPGTMIGASGAVIAVAVVYTLFYPRREVLFMFVIPVEMWVLMSVFVGFQFYLMLRPGVDMRTAVEAHLAGAAYGYLFKRFDLRWSKLPWSGVRRPRLRIVSADPPREKPVVRPSTSAGAGPTWAANPASVAKPASTAVVPEEQLDAKLDEVLAKIAREGRAGLSEDENRVLQEASRRARNRRSDRL